MTHPKISVLMPAYNAEKYIGEAIESILNQTFTDFEFIIVNDCSTDRTGEIIQEYAKKDERIIAVKNEQNLKICKTLNKGIELAKGEYIARMDADDWSYPERLQKQYEYMESHPEIGISGGTMEVCDENMQVLNRRMYNLTDSEIREKLFFYSPFCHATTIYRTELVKSLGGYNHNLWGAEDYDLYFRVGKYSKFGNQDKIFYKMRVNNGSISQTRAKRQELLTIFIRIKAIVEYGYTMNFKERIYTIAQFLSIFLIPSKVKFWIFNLLR